MNDDELERILMEAVMAWLRHYPHYSPGETKKPWKTWVMVVGVPAEIWTQHLLNTNLEHYRYTNVFGVICYHILSWNYSNKVSKF
jgi:hypothetical protein